MTENDGGTVNREMIAVDGVCKFYGRFAAVKDVTFSVPAQQVCAFLGPNGAGKSTTMKILTGFLAPTRGTVTIDGLSMADSRIEASMKIGYLPENGPLYDEMTPSSALSYLARARGLNASRKRDRTAFVMDQCNLEEVWNKPISKLSRGFRQRVGMAQALLHDPEILILDEPTSGLDPNQLVGIRKLIRTLGETKTVLLSTHVLQEVENLCDRVVLINNGQLVYDDSISDMGNRQEMEQKFHELTKFNVEAVS
ncbi:MAG: ABC transporter ATP-binding protein [Planctomycetota bacterium]